MQISSHRLSVDRDMSVPYPVEPIPMSLLETCDATISSKRR
jgi:hypothetical protein